MKLSNRQLRKMRASHLTLAAAVMLLALLALTTPGAAAIARNFKLCARRAEVHSELAWCLRRRRCNWLAAQACFGTRGHTGGGQVCVHRQPFQGYCGRKG